jgi:hypothetical protein
MMWPRLVTVALGVWLMAAPAVLHSERAAATGEDLIGPILVGVSCASASPVLRELRWLALPAAGWLVAGSWLPGADAATIANDIVVSLAVAALTFVRARGQRRYGDGWRAVLPLLARSQRAPV